MRIVVFPADAQKATPATLARPGVWPTEIEAPWTQQGTTALGGDRACWTPRLPRDRAAHRGACRDAVDGTPRLPAPRDGRRGPRQVALQHPDVDQDRRSRARAQGAAGGHRRGVPVRLRCLPLRRQASRLPRPARRLHRPSPRSAAPQEPGLGRDLAIDASDLPAYANGQRYLSRTDPSASVTPIPTRAGVTARPSALAKAAGSTATASTRPSAPARTCRSLGG
jgi:hypothetical protein